MRIGLVGSGGREHAIAKVLARNPARDSLYIFASHPNPGIEPLAATTETGDLHNTGSVVDFFLTNHIDLVVVGPEAPLLAGVIDALRDRGILAVGPTQSQARIEGDKAFMRDLLQRRVGWGAPAWRVVQSRREGADFISEVGEVAVKPIGLTGGKGVSVMGVHLLTLDDALDQIEILIKKDRQVLLEERLVGEEFSRMVFVSDNNVIPMPVAQDFKYAYDGDHGGMTGGMGAYTCADGSLPFLLPDDLDNADRLIGETVDALAAETGEPYRGFLYGQFIATANGVRVIEFNARLGDPEAINMMALLEADAAHTFYQIANGELKQDQRFFSSLASVSKYLVPKGYPDDVGEPLKFNLDETSVLDAGLSIIYASVIGDHNGYQTMGSRTMALIGTGEEPGEVSSWMESLLLEIQPHGLRHRVDIGDARVIQSKLARMAQIRGIRSDDE